MRTGCACACVCFFFFFFGMVRVTAEGLCFYTLFPLPLLASLRRLPDGREHRVDRSDSLNDEALSANFTQRRHCLPWKTLISNVSPLPKSQSC